MILCSFCKRECDKWSSREIWFAHSYRGHIQTHKLTACIDCLHAAVWDTFCNKPLELADTIRCAYYETSSPEEPPD